jgi:transcription initiation factor TFIIB
MLAFVMCHVFQHTSVLCRVCLHTQTQEFKTLKGRSNRAVYAACIFVAGKRESSHRTFKEICAVMGSDVDKVDIGRCFTAIDK